MTVSSYIIRSIKGKTSQCGKSFTVKLISIYCNKGIIKCQEVVWPRVFIRVIYQLYLSSDFYLDKNTTSGSIAYILISLKRLNSTSCKIHILLNKDCIVGSKIMSLMGEWTFWACRENLYQTDKYLFDVLWCFIKPSVFSKLSTHYNVIPWKKRFS